MIKVVSTPCNLNHPLTLCAGLQFAHIDPCWVWSQQKHTESRLSLKEHLNSAIYEKQSRPIDALLGISRVRNESVDKARPSHGYSIFQKINFLIWKQICPTLDTFQAIGTIFVKIWQLFFDVPLSKITAVGILNSNISGSNRWNILENSSKDPP